MKKPQDAFSGRKKAVHQMLHSFRFPVARCFLQRADCFTLPVPVTRFRIPVERQAVLSWIVHNVSYLFWDPYGCRSA